MRERAWTAATDLFLTTVAWLGGYVTPEQAQLLGIRNSVPRVHVQLKDLESWGFIKRVAAYRAIYQKCLAIDQLYPVQRPDAVSSGWTPRSTWPRAGPQQLPGRIVFGDSSRKRSRMDQAYLDKLDGKITAEFWEQKNAEWLQQEQRVQFALAGLEPTDEPARLLTVSRNLASR